VVRVWYGFLSRVDVPNVDYPFVLPRSKQRPIDIELQHRNILLGVVSSTCISWPLFQSQTRTMPSSCPHTSRLSWTLSANTLQMRSCGSFNVRLRAPEGRSHTITSPSHPPEMIVFGSRNKMLLAVSLPGKSRYFVLPFFQHHVI
jgi:hypothetical protein